MERLAIMGGTFDPIHMGHLRMAYAVQRQLDFDRVVFLPAYLPPHKQTRSDFASWQDRLAMVELAIQNYDNFVVSSLEFDRGGISYTYDTVNFMQELWPDAEIYLIIGEDSLTQLYTWYRVPDLLRLVHFVAAERPGFQTRFFPFWPVTGISACRSFHAALPIFFPPRRAYRVSACDPPLRALRKASADRMRSAISS